MGERWLQFLGYELVLWEVEVVGVALAVLRLEVVGVEVVVALAILGFRLEVVTVVQGFEVVVSVQGHEVGVEVTFPVAIILL